MFKNSEGCVLQRGEFIAVGLQKKSVDKNKKMLISYLTTKENK